MPNPHVLARLQAALGILKAAHSGGSALSAASRGTEREDFISQALANVIAPPFRVASGDITDASGARSGQLDIVIEYATSISLPLGGGSSRLYLAEGVCAVIEVKSDLTRQWDEVLSSRAKLAPLRRRFHGSISLGGSPAGAIPHFAVGYRGWSAIETVQGKLREAGLSGIVVIEHEIYAGNIAGQEVFASGAGSLLGFYIHMQRLTGGMLGSSPDYVAYLT